MEQVLLRVAEKRQILPHVQEVMGLQCQAIALVELIQEGIVGSVTYGCNQLLIGYFAEIVALRQSMIHNVTKLVYEFSTVHMSKSLNQTLKVAIMLTSIPPL